LREPSELGRLRRTKPSKTSPPPLFEPEFKRALALFLFSLSLSFEGAGIEEPDLWGV
jgi:hypothetical protein